MNTPWKVLGFEKWENENGEECVRLYVFRPLALEEGHTGDGVETDRIFFKPKYVKYDPVINHMIIPIKGRFGVQEIMVVGIDKVA